LATAPLVEEVAHIDEQLGFGGVRAGGWAATSGGIRLSG
jgi:hypothetical protein